MERPEGPTIYRTCSPVVDERYDDAEDRTVSEVLVDALAEAEGADPTELPCLYETLDLDILTQLFEGRDGTDSPDAVLSFAFEQWSVFVRADGRILVCDGQQYTDPVPVFTD